MAKNYGPGVSGYNIPDGRNWETVVFQASKPVLDRELNLNQDLSEAGDQSALRESMPSGWLIDDPVTTSDPTEAIFTPNVTANTIEIPNGMLAHVNGWKFPVKDSYATGSNNIDLGAGPVAVGERRTDIVVLEVWRRLLSASPDVVGKSVLGRIWQNGNVATDPANDAVLNFPDDILDAAVGSESTKRVQIQYRLRVVQDVDLFAYPYGLNDPTVFANSVPAAPAAPDGAVTVFGYASQSGAGDAGLWRAGDGNPANTLGTVDGYMYAIPVLAVFRRNTSAFARLDNQNGGVASPGPSDRPDGLFSDVIVARDVFDMRHGVSSAGWSLPEVLDKNFNYLLDNNLHTEIVDTVPNGGGYVGSTVFLADEIGVLPGDGITTGDTTAGSFRGELDAVRRRFSDRSIYETVTIEIPAPGGAWADGSVVTIDPSALGVYPYAPYNWASFAPATVAWVDIASASWLGATGKKTEEALPWLDIVTGLGEIPVVSLSITVGAVATGLLLTDESLFVDLVVAYPPGGGLSKTPTADYGAASFSPNNAIPVGAPNFFDAYTNLNLDSPHREAQMEYLTTTQTVVQAADTTQVALDTFRLPERVASISTVLLNAAPIAGGVTLDMTGRIATFTNPADFTSPGDELTIQYEALRPLPQSGHQMTIYYEARAPQAARSGVIGTDIDVVPKLVSPKLTALTTGSGSQDEGYPFPYAYVQTGGIFPNSVSIYSGEQELRARADVSVTDFNASTGMLTLPTFVPMVADPQSLHFTRGLGDIDVEGRSYFKEVPAGYIPNAYAQDLSDAKRHKDVVPLLAELAEDSIYGFKGQLVLVLLLRYAAFDETNAVEFDADQTMNTTVASIFKIKGNLLDKRVV